MSEASNIFSLPWFLVTTVVNQYITPNAVCILFHAAYNIFRTGMIKFYQQLEYYDRKAAMKPRRRNETVKG